ncbi:hypothetical protein PIB30_051607 [Stylosanthes scabra]|uniref:Uncharacterized protein n=1 Tax=Stylosanthes scabra TaxID=79078 RepID=A0ABU6QIL3_9FABA|nr:hypothetical protein [Stylosanthes scabra]
MQQSEESSWTKEVLQTSSSDDALMHSDSLKKTWKVIPTSWSVSLEKRVTPDGFVTLWTTIGDPLNRRNVKVRWLVVNHNSAYSAIMGRPTLNREQIPKLEKPETFDKCLLVDLEPPE